MDAVSLHYDRSKHEQKHLASTSVKILAYSNNEVETVFDSLVSTVYHTLENSPKKARALIG